MFHGVLWRQARWGRTLNLAARPGQRALARKPAPPEDLEARGHASWWPKVHEGPPLAIEPAIQQSEYCKLAGSALANELAM